ncbi:cutinase family protein [Nocardia sp. NPDC052566]|uniref:cutinase family protein n=1 Tax=Nocardia sp. NPDC052566 TaxID=3364330 RepID=UPI0037CA064F
MISVSVTHSSKRVAVTTMVTLGVAIGSTAVANPAMAPPGPAGCAAAFNLFIPGTWETSEAADPARPIGMLGPVAEAVQREQGPKSAIYFTPYMARAFDNGFTYADSKNTAVRNAQKALRDYGTRCPAANFTITGYSQGADAAGDLAAEIGNDRGPVPAERVLAVGLLADPGAGTDGENVVGPRTSGTGIGEPRPQGMGKLAGRVSSICHPEDLYCAIQKADNPLLGLLGSLLSKTLSTADPGLATSLTSDFSKADLPAMASAASNLGTDLDAEGDIDLTRLRDNAESLVNTIGPLADLIGSGAATPAATTRLAGAPAGTAEHDASEVLTNAGQSDLPGAMSALRTITGTLAALLDGGVETLRADAPEIASLTTAVEQLGDRIAPLTATAPDTLGAAATVLPTLKPGALVGQMLTLVGKVATFDFPGFLGTLGLLVQKVLARDIEGARAAAATLTNQLRPLVDLVAQVDLRRISQTLSDIPDPQGYTKIAAAASSVLAAVDIGKLAGTVRRIQDGTTATLADLLPLGTELASAATELEQIDLGELAATIAPNVDLVTLVNDGLSAANFFLSGAHAAYGSLVVDGKGRNAIQWLGDWLNQQIGHAP